MTTNKITIVTCTKDRHLHLKSTLPNNQKIKNFDEHILVDFSSEEELVINTKKYDKTKIFKVKNEERWWLTRAYNTSFFLSKNEWVLKLDADVRIDLKMFQNLNYEDYDLIVLFNKPNDPGNFLVKKNILKKVNGFNEYMWEWGWSDHDLINRIKKLRGIKFLDTYGVINKIEHDDSSRSKIVKSKFFKNEKLFYYSIIKAHNDSNALLSSFQLWNDKKKLIYKVEKNNIKLNHFFTTIDLDILKRIKYKFCIIKSFSKIYYQKNITMKYFFILIVSILPHRLIDRLFSIQIYPRRRK